MRQISRLQVLGVFKAPLTHVQTLAFLSHELRRVEGWIPWFHPPIPQYDLEQIGAGRFFDLGLGLGRAGSGAGFWGF